MNNKIILNNRVVVITGATGGIGSALAEKLHNEGANLILVGRDKQKLDLLNSSLGGKHKIFPCDFTSQENVVELSRKLKTLGTIDILCNAAGIGIYKPIKEAALDEWNTSLNTNLTAPFILTKELLPNLEKSEMSLVLNIGSGAGVIPQRFRSLYATTKFALRGLTLCLNEEYKETKPHFCLITLGSTLTNFGGMTIEQKKEAALKGRAYFPVEWVVNKLIEIITDEKRKEEYVLYPGDEGFGKWKKP